MSVKGILQFYSVFLSILMIFLQQNTFKQNTKSPLTKFLFSIGDLVFIIKKVLNSFFCRNFKSNVENYNVEDIHSKQVYDIIISPNIFTLLIHRHIN